MSFKIKNHRDLTLGPIHILSNPKLSLTAKGAAAVMYSYEDLLCRETEIVNLLGVSMLNQIFNKAEANDLIRKNPVRFAEKKRKTGPVQRKECFTAEEVTALMEMLPDDRMDWSIWI